MTGRDWRGGHSTGRAASPGTGTSSSDKKRTTFSVVSAQRRKAFSRKSRYYLNKNSIRLAKKSGAGDAEMGARQLRNTGF